MVALPCLRYRRTNAKPYPASYPNNPSSIGEHIRKKRMDLGLLQADIAKQLRVSDETINNWENGHRVPQINFYPRIFLFLGYNPVVLDENTIAGKIFAYRCRFGLSYRSFGKQLGVDASTVRGWEHGKCQPKNEILIKLQKDDQATHL
jgi:transcriptional regulator with XRE-family HTH domain